MEQIIYVLKSPGGMLLLETCSYKRTEVWPNAETFFRKQLAYRSVSDYQSKARRSGWRIVAISVKETSA